MQTTFKNKHVQPLSALVEFKNDVADLLAMYASDQRRMITRQTLKRDKVLREEAARVYQSAADEIRAIVIVAAQPGEE